MRIERKGTPSWVAPEIVKGHRYGKEVDVWAFGCFAFELLARVPPFHAYYDEQDLNPLFHAIIE